MRRTYPHVSTSTIARQLRRTVQSIHGRAAVLGLHKSAAYLASPDACRLRRGDGVGAQFRFQQGQVPANKGVRRPGWSAGRMKETQFKPGARSGKSAQLWMPIGSTRLMDGYVYVKVADVPNVPYTVNWLPLHVIEWERVHGPLPAGHCLRFKDGNRAHVDLANLELQTRGENLRRNSMHNLPKPLADTIRVLGALNRQLRRRTQSAEQH